MEIRDDDTMSRYNSSALALLKGISTHPAVAFPLVTYIRALEV